MRRSKPQKSLDFFSIFGDTEHKSSHLNREDQKFNCRNSNQTEIQHATYKNGIWQSNTLGQMLATQTMHSAMVAQQMYSENLRLDEADLKKAKAIYDARKINESGASAIESKGSLGNNFIEQFISRLGIRCREI